VHGTPAVEEGLKAKKETNDRTSPTQLHSWLGVGLFVGLGQAPDRLLAAASG